MLYCPGILMISCQLNFLKQILELLHLVADCLPYVLFILEQYFWSKYSHPLKCEIGEIHVLVVWVHCEYKWSVSAWLWVQEQVCSMGILKYKMLHLSQCVTSKICGYQYEYKSILTCTSSDNCVKPWIRARTHYKSGNTV